MPAGEVACRRACQRTANGHPEWLAIVGHREVGKTSLILEACRRHAGEVATVVVDVLETAPVSLSLFRTIALAAADAVLGGGLDTSLAVQARRPPREYLAALARAPAFAKLPPALQGSLAALSEPRVTSELAMLSGAQGADPLPVMRSVWQRHAHVAYVISGSARTLLLDLVTRQHSPFFQHFDLLELGAFSEADAVELLTGGAPSDRPIPPDLALRAAEVLGGHPFYLQLLGEALVRYPPPLDADTFKDALQELLFSRTGRLALFFESEHARLVGRSAQLALSLEALAEGPQRVTDLATSLGARTGDASRYLERLGDAIVRRDDGRYEIADAVFGSWIRWRKPGGSVTPMKLIGDAAEIAAAAQLGFDLVYQSRASRGAFDLLALRGPVQLGVQVKRSPLPLRFPRSEWSRMEADAARLGWRWVVAQVEPDGAVRVLDPAKATRAREVRLDQAAVIPSLLGWVDAWPKKARTRRRNPS